jgi:hypothetical protein
MKTIKNWLIKTLLESLKLFKKLVIQFVVVAVTFPLFIFFLKISFDTAIRLKLITPNEIMEMLTNLEHLNWMLITQNIIYFGMLIMLTTHLFNIIKPLIQLLFPNAFSEKI